MKTILLLIAVMILAGCQSKPVAPAAPTVTDARGYRYRKVSAEVKLAPPFEDVELWERTEPADTNRFYTPTLAWEMAPTNTPSFNSILK